jgi:hypothetical protein
MMRMRKFFKVAMLEKGEGSCQNIAWKMKREERGEEQKQNSFISSTASE